MAQSAGEALITAQKLTDHTTTQLHPLGARVKDRAGNEYIYLLGVASTAANDWVVYDESFATTRLVGNEVGPVAIALAATVANEYGWYQIYGKANGKNGNVVSGDKALYISSVTGACDDLLVTGDKINGATSYEDETVTGAGVGVMLNYPYVDDATT